MDDRTPSADQFNAALVDFFKALVDPERLRVAGLIAGTPSTAAEIAAALALPVRRVVNHLGALVARELVRVEGAGAGARYRWDETRLRQLAAEHLDSPRVRALGGATDERSRVLATFVRDGRLVQFPTGEARKRVILEYIAGRFEAERTYTEREVNAMLKEFAEDYATIRRALVDRAFLNRREGVYWVGAGWHDHPAPP